MSNDFNHASTTVGRSFKGISHLHQTGFKDLSTMSGFKIPLWYQRRLRNTSGRQGHNPSYEACWATRKIDKKNIIWHADCLAMISPDKTWLLKMPCPGVKFKVRLQQFCTWISPVQPAALKVSMLKAPVTDSLLRTNRESIQIFSTFWFNCQLAQVALPAQTLSVA